MDVVCGSTSVGRRLRRRLRLSARRRRGRSSAASAAASRTGGRRRRWRRHGRSIAWPLVVFVVEQGHAGHGEIAAAAGEFLKAPAPARRPGRQPHLGDDFVGFERGGQRPEEESAAAIVRSPLRAGDRDLGVAGERDARHFGRRIGMREAAADGAAIADLVMRRHARWPRRAADARSAAACRPRCRASAPGRPMRTPSSAMVMRSSPGSLRRSTSSDGEATRNAIIGTRL